MMKMMRKVFDFLKKRDRKCIELLRQVYPVLIMVSFKCEERKEVVYCYVVAGGQDEKSIID